MIADAATKIEGSRLMVYKAAWLKQIGANYTQEAAMAKLFASEMAESVCRDAIQILGSYGYSSEYPVERYYRDAKIGVGLMDWTPIIVARATLAFTVVGVAVRFSIRQALDAKAAVAQANVDLANVRTELADFRTEVAKDYATTRALDKVQERIMGELKELNKKLDRLIEQRT